MTGIQLPAPLAGPSAELLAIAPLFLASIKNLHTRDQYAAYLKRFARFSTGAPDVPLAAARLLAMSFSEAERLIVNFRADLERGGTGPRTASVVIVPVRGVWNHAYGLGLVSAPLHWTYPGRRRKLEAGVAALHSATPFEDPTTTEVSPSDPLLNLVAAFLAGLDSEFTRLAYGDALRSFARFQGSEDPRIACARLLALPRGQAFLVGDAFKVYLTNRGLATSTIAHRLNALKAFVAFAYNAGAVEFQLHVKPPKVFTYRDTRGPAPDMVAALIALLELDPSPQGRRNLAMFRLLADRGLRVNEVTTLDLEHVEEDGGVPVAWVLGKCRGGSREKVTLAPATWKAVKEWIAVRPGGSGPLFTPFSANRPRDRLGRLTNRGVYIIVRDLGRRLGIDNLHPHSLRHCAITTALDMLNGDVRKVQRFSRHSSAETVIRYDDNRRDFGGEITNLLADAWGKDRGTAKEGR